MWISEILMSKMYLFHLSFHVVFCHFTGHRLLQVENWLFVSQLMGKVALLAHLQKPKTLESLPWHLILRFILCKTRKVMTIDLDAPIYLFTHLFWVPTLLQSWSRSWDPEMYKTESHFHQYTHIFPQQTKPVYLWKLLNCDLLENWVSILFLF